MTSSEACNEMLQRHGYFIFANFDEAMPQPKGVVTIYFPEGPDGIPCRVIGPASLEDANILRELLGMGPLGELLWPFYRAVAE